MELFGNLLQKKLEYPSAQENCRRRETINYLSKKKSVMRLGTLLSFALQFWTSSDPVPLLFALKIAPANLLQFQNHRKQVIFYSAQSWK